MSSQGVTREEDLALELKMKTGDSLAPSRWMHRRRVEVFSLISGLTQTSHKYRRK